MAIYQHEKGEAVMLSVLVWLAMQGQVQKPDLSQLTDPGIVRPLPQLTKCIDNGDDTTTCPNSLLRVIIDHVDLPKPKPAEHVIEIKTVRKKREVSRTSDIWPGSREHAKCNKGEGAVNDYVSFLIGVGAVGVTTIQYCEYQTRELWIDGVRIGIVKGLD